MICLYRVDDRLIHGQVQTTWIASTGTQAILIIDDKTKDDIIAQQILKAVKPPGISLKTVSEGEALAALEEALESPKQTMVLFKELETAGRLAKQGYTFDALNIGPVSAKTGAKSVGRNAHLTEAEMEVADDLSAAGVAVYLQLTPDMKKTTWDKVKK